jgi:hypothetical protein
VQATQAEVQADQTAEAHQGNLMVEVEVHRGILAAARL